MAEEIGFFGVATVVSLFAWLVIRAFVIGRRAAALERHFSALAAQGDRRVAGRAGFYKYGREMGVLPTKGIDTTVNEFQQQHRRQLRYAGGAHARGLGERAVDEGVNDMKTQRTRWQTRIQLLGLTSYSRHSHRSHHGWRNRWNVFPGLAVADYMKSAGWRVIWLGTEGGMETTLAPRHGYDMETIRSRFAR